MSQLLNCRDISNLSADLLSVWQWALIPFHGVVLLCLTFSLLGVSDVIHVCINYVCSYVAENCV
jgi:hypothetical protein